MRYLRNRKVLRSVTYFMVSLLVLEVALPLSSYALTGGPGQPEFSSYEPVSTVKMVNEFTGDFTYNLPLLEIPGPDGSGYPLSLSYHSGASPEEDASWVGYGWTLNPGAISRSTAGYPDDFKGEEVIQYNRVPANKTTSLGGYAGNLEAFGFDALLLNANAALRYNNYTGFGYVAGLNVDRAGIGSLGYSVSDGQGSFTYKINPGGLLQKENWELNKKGKDGDPAMMGSDQIRQNAKDHEGDAKLKSDRKSIVAKFIRRNSFPISLRSVDQRPTTVTPFLGLAFNFTASFQGNIAPLPVGAEAGFFGTYARQKNIPIVSNNAYGFMYSGHAGEEDVMDYVTEKEQLYTKRDNYLGIPQSTPDQFVVTGEMLGGGFRLHNRNTTHFRKNKVISKTVTGQVGLEIMLGANSGVGADFGVGFGRLKTEEWSDEGLTAAKNGDEPFFFRFNNDQGGYIDRGSAEATRAGIQLNPAGVGNKPSIPGSIPSEMNNGKRAQRSSYIGYHTMDEMQEGSNNGNAYRLYTHRTDLLDNTSYLNRNSLPGSSLGELSITNADGITHNFGLPVYARNETNLRYLLTDIPSDNYLIHQPLTKNDAPYVVGQEKNTPYATQFLLTEILSPDFVDRTLDGPTEDDFGGYTKFHYHREHGSNDKADGSGWYKWRIPYNGLLYDRGLLSDKKDDAASVSYGEKEIYYLEQVETRTHYANFILSSAVRNDGLDAASAEGNATNSLSAQGSNGLRSLDKIELYRKNPNGPDELIKTVVFEYDYSAWGCGTAVNTKVPNSTNGGKLTLRRVYFEYEGKHNYLISPYEFYYNYPQATQPGFSCNGSSSSPFKTHGVSDYPTDYDALEVNAAALDETPNFEPRNLDPWGSYQGDGLNRYNAFRPWMDQKPDADFDPAVYQLKSITLPSGGQIHVQYEQDDYRYVQNRDAMAMVRIDPTGSDDSDNGNDHKYYLETGADLDLTGCGSCVNEMRDLIQARFVDGDERIYFKFLYKLLGSGTPNFDKCDSEFIDGYVKVEDVGVDAGNRLWISLGGPAGANEYKYPRQVCRDYYTTQRAGAIEKNDDCGPGENVEADESNITNTIQKLMGWLGGTFGNNCTEWAPEYSYFRIPVPRAKKGGGIRVKRLLMYDEGLEGERKLYGTEYDYTMIENGKQISSGVATREPASVREEDPLVNLLPRQQSWANRILAGKDRKQVEGPIGENLIGSASVGYRRVVAKSIHTGRTNPGYTIHEFNTCKEFPYDRSYAAIDGNPAFNATTPKTKSSFVPTLPFGQYKVGIDNRWVTQGYRFVKYNIDGQPKRISAYIGDPAQSHDPASSSMISSQEFEYFQPGENVPIMTEVDQVINNAWFPGSESEIVMESRAIHDVNLDVSTEGDASISFFGILVIPLSTAIPGATYTERRLYTHVTSKVISYPAIQKATRSYQDGIWHRTEHLAYNPESGQPILTMTTDGYDDLQLPLFQDPNGSGGSGPYVQEGVYRAYTIPGSREYEELGQRADNERLILPGTSGVTLTKENIGGEWFLVAATAGASDPCQAIEGMVAGDRVRISTQNGEDGIYTLGEPNGHVVPLLSSFHYNANTSYTGPIVVEVIHSGKTNQLGMSAGGFTTYGGPHSISVTPISPGILNARQDIADGLNIALAAVSVGNPATHFLDPGYCDFTHSFSDDVGIQLSLDYANGSGSNYVLEIELQDWAHTAQNFRCSEKVPGFSGGTFAVDQQTGELVFYSSGNTCEPFALPCLKFCNTEAEVREMPGVVVASAQTFADEWLYSQSLYGAGPSGANDYETGVRGNWRPLGSYSFRTNIIPGGRDDNPDMDRIYRNAGVFPLELFNYQATSANDPVKWLRMNTVTQYSPHGMALEEQNILGIYSAAHFGYDQTVPTAVAQNSTYDKCYFEGFEMRYGPSGSYELENNVSIANGQWNTGIHHSGRGSCNLDGSNSDLMLKPFQLDGSLADGGFSLQLWVRDLSNTLLPVQVELAGPSMSSILPLAPQARSGEWVLYEGKITAGVSWNFANSGDWITPRVFRSPSVSSSVEIDDVRYQPLDAQMTCYVYDPATLRLLCTFDDQHFGLYNQYNGEGQLVRKRIETSRGMKTVQETQYHSVQTGN